MGDALPFDREKFLRERRTGWDRLAKLLRSAETLPLNECKELAALYRRASSDLLVARDQGLDAPVVDYLNDLVATGFSVLHRPTRSLRAGRIWRFLWTEFPTHFQKEFRLVVLAAALLFSGAFLGAGVSLLDPTSVPLLIPESHQELTPDERITQDEDGQTQAADQAAMFSSFLFTHNIRVSLLVFALGITLGLGTALVLFFNGVPLGALAVSYHQAGHGLFFWAWILPHGIPELTVVCIAGASGFMLGRGLLKPGPGQLRRISLQNHARQAVRLLLGALPLLILAGLIEGTVSQMHEPTISYSAKLVIAAFVAIGSFSYLTLPRRWRNTVVLEV